MDIGNGTYIVGTYTTVRNRKFLFIILKNDERRAERNIMQRTTFVPTRVTISRYTITQIAQRFFGPRKFKKRRAYEGACGRKHFYLNADGRESLRRKFVAKAYEDFARRLTDRGYERCPKCHARHSSVRTVSR